MSDREKFLKEKISSLVPKETELESRGEHFDFHAPVTCSVTTSHSIAVGFGDGKVRFFFEGEKKPSTIDAHNGVVLSIATNGEYIFTGGDDGRFLKLSQNGDIVEIANFNSRWVDSVAAYKDSMVCSSGRNVYIWSGDQKKAKSLEHSSTVGGLAFDHTGKRLAVSSYGGVTLWERGERRWTSKRLVWKGSHSKVGFSPDGKYLVIGSPNASNVKTKYAGSFQNAQDYPKNSIVAKDQGLWRSKIDIEGKEDNIIFNSFDSVTQRTIAAGLTNDNTNEIQTLLVVNVQNHKHLNFKHKTQFRMKLHKSNNMFERIDKYFINLRCVF